MGSKFISKLSSKYAQVEPSDWIIGSSSVNIAELDPIFLGRLAALAKDKKTKMYLTTGYRTSAQQIELYRRYLAGTVKLAARPGTSAHEYRLAIDTSTQPFRSMTTAELTKYGLHKPLKSEGWHIQPIEIKGGSMTLADKANWVPVEDDEVIDKTDIYVNGAVKSVTRINKDDINFIKLRDFDDILGIASVSYNKEKKMPEITFKGATDVELLVDGQRKIASVVNVAGTNYIKLRDIDTVLGLASVSYNKEKKLPELRSK